MTAFVASPIAAPGNYTITAGGPPVTVTVANSGSSSTASFTGTAGQRVSLNMSSVTITSSVVSVLKPGGTNLVSPLTVTKGGHFLDVQTLPTTGTYRIVVDPKSTYTGHMVLTLYDVPADVTGAIATDGTPATVTTTTPGQNAKLTFAGTATQRVSVNVTGVDFASGKLRIYNPDGTLLYPTALSFSPAGGFLEPKLLAQTGTYTLQIDPQLLYAGSATAQLYIVPADPTNALTPCATQPCTPTSAATGTPGQNAYYTFSTLAANQRVSLLFSNSTYDALHVSVLKPDSTTLYTPATTVTSLDTFVDTKTLAAVGQYKVFLDPSAASTGGVDVTVFSVPADVTGAITAGTPFTATTTMPGQNALYTYSGTANQRISLDLSNVTYDSAKVSVLKPDGTLLFAALTVTSLGKFVEPTKLPVTGTYKVKVDPVGISTGSMDVKLAVVPADLSGALTPAVAKTAAIGTAGQNAVYTYAGTAGQRIALNLTNAATLGSSACCSAKVKITKPDGSYLVLPTSFGTDGKFIDVKTLPVTGTYKVTIDPQGNATGSVDVTLYLVPADASTTSGALTSGGVAANVTTTLPGQNAKVQFTGAVGQRFAFKLVSFSAGFCDVKLSVLRPDGSTLTYPTCATNGDWFDTKTLTLAGTYKIVVDPQGTSTGTASFTLYSPPADFNGALSGSASLTPGQNGVYTFSVAGGPKTATITPNSGGTINLTGAYLESSNGSIEYDSTFWDTSGGTALSASLPTGNYRLRLDPVGDAAGSMSFALALS